MPKRQSMRATSYFLTTSTTIVLFIVMLTSCAHAWVGSSSRSIKSVVRTSLRSTFATTMSQQQSVELKHTEFSSTSSTSTSSGPADDTDAPPVLLLHGLLGNKRNFSTIGRSLSHQLERKRRIIGVDLRNHGALHAVESVESVFY
jgi:predicted alpha/beta-fold hydrolase